MQALYVQIADHPLQKLPRTNTKAVFQLLQKMNTKNYL